MSGDVSGDVLEALTTALKALGLTALAATLPLQLEQTRRQEPTYDVFLAHALEVERAGRALGPMPVGCALPASPPTRPWRILTSAFSPAYPSGSFVSWRV